MVSSNNYVARQPNISKAFEGSTSGEMLLFDINTETFLWHYLMS